MGRWQLTSDIDHLLTFSQERFKERGPKYTANRQATPERIAIAAGSE
jgi:hypothetical protein